MLIKVPVSFRLLSINKTFIIGHIWNLFEPLKKTFADFVTLLYEKKESSLQFFIELMKFFFTILCIYLGFVFLIS